MVIVAESAVRSLSRLKPHYRGRNGERGGGGYRVGASGKATIIKVLAYSMYLWYILLLLLRVIAPYKISSH